MKASFDEELFKISGVKLRAKGLLVIQVLFLLGWAYAAHEFWNDISAGGTITYVALATLVYIIFFFVLIVNILVKKTFSIRAAKIKVVIIFILNIIPAALLLWFAASDIF
jgi:hypothetical protein